MIRRLALISVFTLAACEQSVAPSPPLQRPSVQAASNGLDDVIRENLKMDIGGTIDDPCTGETIALDGTSHIVMTIDQASDGATLNYHSNTQGVTGVGLQTGTKYQFVQILSEDQSVFIPANGSATVVVHERIISDGSADNFLTDIGYTFTFPPFIATYEFKNERCGG